MTTTTSRREELVRKSAFGYKRHRPKWNTGRVRNSDQFLKRLNLKYDRFYGTRTNTVDLLSKRSRNTLYINNYHSSHRNSLRSSRFPSTLYHNVHSSDCRPNSEETVARVDQRQHHSRHEENLILPLSQLHNDGDRVKPQLLEEDQVTPMYVLCIPLHKLSRSVQFVVCVCGVMFFYLLSGYILEWIFTVEGFKPFGWYLTMIQFAFYSVFGSLERRLRNEGRRKIPLSTYAILAFLTVSTMGLSNSSLGYLNYPTQVIFKSCKLIPVMIGGMLIQGKKYTFFDGVALICMSIGLIMFTLADSTVQPEFNKTGVLLISLALCADAVIGNVQEKALKGYAASNLEMVLFSYFIGFWYILMGLVLSGSLLPAFNYCMEYPKVYLMASVFSLTGYLGINFVLVLVRSFGALLAVTVTTFRKALTVVLSFLLFTKPFTGQYIWAGLIVLAGILLNLYSKNKTKVNSYMALQSARLKYMVGRYFSTRAFKV